MRSLKEYNFDEYELIRLLEIIQILHYVYSESTYTVHRWCWMKTEGVPYSKCSDVYLSNYESLKMFGSSISFDRVSPSSKIFKLPFPKRIWKGSGENVDFVGKIMSVLILWVVLISSPTVLWKIKVHLCRFYLHVSRMWTLKFGKNGCKINHL